jgi:hypothetical protein
MAGPYDYTVNIPQPPAQNFLQSLLGIQQLKGLQQQSQLAEQQAAIQQQNAAFQQQMQPLEMAKARAAEKAALASAASSYASAAESGARKGLIGVQVDVAKLGLQERQKISSAIDAFNKDPNTGIVELAKVAPYMDDNTRAGIAKSVPFYIGQQIDKALASDEEITPEQYQKWSNALTLLPTAEQQQARNAILSMPQNLQTFTKSGVIGITNAALNGDREAAMFASDEAAKALYNSNHPAARVTAGLFDKLTNQLKDESVDLRKVPVSALNVSTLIQDKGFQGALIDTLEKSEAIQKATTEKPLPASIVKNNIDIGKKVTAAEEQAAKLTQAAEAMKVMPSRGAAMEWWINTAPKLNFAEDPEIAIRNNAAQLSGLGMLGQEAAAMGGAIRSNVQFQYATNKLPSAWSSPKELVKRLEAQAEVQSRLAKLMQVDAEWNSAFRGNPKSSKATQIMGKDVEPGTSIFKFKEELAKELFPPDEKRADEPMQPSKPAPSPRRGSSQPVANKPMQPSKQAPAPDLTMPPAGAVRRVR